MAANLCFHHDRSIGAFIYVQQLSIHTACATGHEFTCLPGINETVVLYAWNQEKPIFVGHPSQVVGHWEDSMDVRLTPSPTYYKKAEKIPDTFLLCILLDLICLTTVQSVIHQFHLRLDRQLRVDKCPDYFLPVYYYPTIVPKTNEVHFRPLVSYDIPSTSIVVTIPIYP